MVLEIITLSLISSVLIFSSGRVFQFLFFNREECSIKNYESGLFGAIILCFIALLFNFFVPLNAYYGSAILIFFLIFFLIDIIFISKKKIEIIYIILFVSVISFLLLIYSNINRPDAGFYHLPYVSILNENKIILGLTNLNQRYGHISIIQYLSASYLNHFTSTEFITFPMASLVGFYFSFLLKLFYDGSKSLKKNNDFIFLLLIFSIYSFSRYSNFGNDAISHLYLYLSVIYFLIFDNSKKYNSLFKILLFSAFAFLNKTFMLLALFLPLVKIIKLKFLSFRTLGNYKFLFCYFFIGIWLVKNLLVSGCLIYPISFTCFDKISFSNIQKTKEVSLEGEAWAKNIVSSKKNLSRDKFVKNFNWFDDWKSDHLKIIIKKISPVLFFVLIFFILKFIFREKKNEINHSPDIKTLLNIFIFSLLSSIVWFVKFPLYRFGQSYLFLLIISSSYFFLKDINVKKKTYIRYCSIITIMGFVLFSLKNINRVKNIEIKNYERSPFPKIYTLNSNEKNEKKNFKIIRKNNKFLYFFSQGSPCMYSRSPCSNYLLENLKLVTVIGYKIYYF